MTRAFILLYDSFGIGAAQDADKFGDVGANTLLHIAEACAAGRAERDKIRHGFLKIPNLTRFGIGRVAKESSGKEIPGVPSDFDPIGLYGYAAPLSYGKDTTSGHWEIAGVPVLFNWGLFPKTVPCFPEELIREFIDRAKIPGILGSKHASGTEIINELGDEHCRTKKPIVYTSADSVFQIAYHEDVNGGLKRLYELCAIARELVTPYNIGRVIARPFIGANGNYTRTEHRRDFSLPPPEDTLLDKLITASCNVIGIGKIPDIFAHRGISKEVEAHGLEELFDRTMEETANAPDNSLIFVNFVDFDMKFGHRRDVTGYANALEQIDKKLPSFERLLRPKDIAIITADHGCDPTFKGTDHTREYIPTLLLGSGIKSKSIGKRDTFADIGQSLAEYFKIKPLPYGKSFL